MSKKKLEIQHVVNLTVSAGNATPGPPIGTVLGPKGINLGDFCKKVNEATLANFSNGTPVPVVLTIYKDRSFTFVTKAPPASYLVKSAAGLEKGASDHKSGSVGSITRDQLRDIAKVKLQYTNARSVEAVMNSIEGSAKSIGIVISES